MIENIKNITEAAGIYITQDGRAIKINSMGCTPVTEEDITKLAEVLVKKCAYLVNDYQRTTGYTDHAKMLCKEFGIEFKDEDYYGDKK